MTSETLQALIARAFDAGRDATCEAHGWQAEYDGYSDRVYLAAPAAVWDAALVAAAVEARPEWSVTSQADGRATIATQREDWS